MTEPKSQTWNQWLTRLPIDQFIADPSSSPENPDEQKPIEKLRFGDKGTKKTERDGT